MAEKRTDVAIVGAGPAGMALAIGLAKRGVGFVILDSLAEAQNTSRAAVIHSATLATLDTLGVADRLVRQGIKVPHFRIRDRDRVLIHADFSQLRTATPFALMIPQDETEAVLVERLAALGHTVRRPALVTEIERAGAEARVHCETAEGAETIRCRYVVGADGAKSVVRSRAGIDFPGSTYGSFLLADVRMRWPVARDEVSLFFSRDGILVVAPMSGERFRVVAQADDAPPVPRVADLQRVIDTRGPTTGAEVTEVLWGSRFQVHHKLADRFLDGPVLLLGDAAHVHSPAGGQGMNLGLRDAGMLAASLAEALQTGSRKPLEHYAATQRSAASHVLQMTDRLTHVATVRSGAGSWLRNSMIASASHISPFRRRFARTLAGVT
jgi:2-polyprenyl-6-methoxyphenol hydroxylase-like FAD-dependent oxidoreductase